MKIAVPGFVFGKNKNLLIKDGEFYWVNNVSPFIPLLGVNKKHPQSIHHIASLLDKKIDGIRDEKIENILSELSLSGELPPISKLVRRDVFKEKLKIAIEQSLDLLRGLEDADYIETFIKCQRVLSGMQEAKIDLERLKKINIKNKSVFSSFKPENNGFLERVSYSNIKTATGRMTVLKGPQILIAPKEVKSCLKSKFKNGKMFQVDYISLEPRVARLLKKGDSERDIYQQTNLELFENKLSREQVKSIFLCAIYGAGERRLSAILPKDYRPRDIVKKLRDYIGFFEIVDRKRVELKKYGKMFNFFGRPVIPSSDRDPIIFNNWLQSTAAEAALLGFEKVINKVKADPVFLIHDAIIFDVKKENVSDFKKYIESGVNISGLGNFLFEYSEL